MVARTTHLVGMPTCHPNYPWNLATPIHTNCAFNGVIMPVCDNRSACPGVCTVSKAGSTTFKIGMSRQLARTGRPLLFEIGCTNVHCARFPWPPWPAPERVVRIVRHPLQRMLSAFLDGKHYKRRYAGAPFSRNASFAHVVNVITSLPDNDVNSNMRRQSAQCAVHPSVPQHVLRLEEYAEWRPWLLNELQWSPDVLPQEPLPQDASVERIDEYYTQELRQRVLEWADDDLKLFGYRP